MAVRHGIDMDALEEFVAYAKQNPDDVQFTLSAAATYEGTCAHSLARVDGLRARW